MSQETGGGEGAESPGHVITVGPPRPCPTKSLITHQHAGTGTVIRDTDPTADDKAIVCGN